MKIFNSVVTPTVLYGSCCWTMTKSRQQKLASAQRRMLRRICGFYHSDSDEETWVEWIQTATHEAEAAAYEAGVLPWVVLQRERKWLWAGQTARKNDNRWSQEALLWTPSTRSRDAGRPLMRWTDCLERFAASFDDTPGSDWYLMAQDASSWSSCTADFCEMD